MFLQLVNWRIGISPNIVKYLMVSLCPGANLFRTGTNVEKIRENGDKIHSILISPMVNQLRMQGADNYALR